MTLPLPGAYTVFATYPRFEAPRPCAHRICVEAQASMQGLPLPTFPVAALNSLFYNHLVGTWGSLADIKHFIPRMLDLLDAEELDLEEFSQLRGLSLPLAWQWPVAHSTRLRDGSAEGSQALPACGGPFPDAALVISGTARDVLVARERRAAATNGGD